MAQAAKLRGEFWPQDHWGRVTNAARPRDALNRPALEASEEAADLALERFGDRLHSVYLSGPAARGRPGGAVIFVLLRLGAAGDVPASRANGSWEYAAASQLRRRHPGLGGRVSLQVFDWKDVFTADGAFSPARFRLAVNSVCVAGRNMNRMLAPQKLDAAAANGDVLAFRSRMLTAAGRIAAAKSGERVRSALLEAGLAVLSAGFALVAEREQVYTEDLDLQRDLFLLNNPSRANDVREAYQMATRATVDPVRALAQIEHACRWMTPMTDAWLNANNPQRAEQLRA
jgi:hypothetical protein